MGSIARMLRPGKTRPRGLSLLEILVAATLLAICAASLTQAHVTAMSATRQSDEYAAAARATREALEIVAATAFDELMIQFPVDPLTQRRFPFRVYLSHDPNDPARGVLPGLVDDYAGELVIVTDETKDRAAWGGDLLPKNGLPDGVKSFPLPLDLNMDGDTLDNHAAIVTNKTGRRYPVGVIIRWMGRYGEERYETWTVISRY